MVREHLSERLKEGGGELLAATDALDMQAQGAMWLYDHNLHDWRFFLVTSLVDTVGRRKTFQLLLDAFNKISLPDGMSVDDVYLASPAEPFFQLVSSIVHADGGVAEFQNCSFNGLQFDGVIYRSVREVPSKQMAERIEKRFAKRVKDLPAELSKAHALHE